jgi:hypothetical protein
MTGCGSPTGWRPRRCVELGDWRDGLIRQLAMQYQGFSSVRALVAAIETALRRYLAGGFRFDDLAPAAPRRGMLWAILRANQCRPLSRSSIRDTLAGVQKTGRKMYTPAAIRQRLGAKSGTKRGCSKS